MFKKEKKPFYSHIRYEGITRKKKRSHKKQFGIGVASALMVGLVGAAFKSKERKP